MQGTAVSAPSAPISSPTLWPSPRGIAPGLRRGERLAPFVTHAPINRRFGWVEPASATHPEPIIATASPSPAPTGLPLSNSTLHRHAGRAAVPTYDRARLVPGVVHIGVGGFHRAHQAVYLDELAERRVSMDWGVVGVGLNTASMRAALAPQDFLYTVVQRGAGEDEVRVVGAMRDCLLAREDPEAVIQILAAEQTRLVTLTVTGGGYHLDPATGELSVDAPEVAHDLRNPTAPLTLPGYLVEALDRRRRREIAPFTVLSCDNVPRNGSAAKASVTGLAGLRDAGLGSWIEERVAFPHSMVDRITPTTTTDARRSLAAVHGVDDRWPVTTEAFSQWVVEDDFCNRRPPLEEVGVEFVADVAPFELIKKRLLNGTHCAMAFLGLLAGHRTTTQVMADPLLGSFIGRLMDDEIAPLLPRVPGVDVREYAETVRVRLANPKMADQLTRLSARSSTKMPAYLLPSLAEACESRRPCDLLSVAVAAWLLSLRELDAGQIQDAHAARLRTLAVDGGDDPRPLLRERWLFGDLGQDDALAEAVGASMRALRRDGPHATVARLLSADLEAAAA
jgi:mannitol 2-dehydrogenase